MYWERRGPRDYVAVGFFLLSRTFPVRSFFFFCSIMNFSFLSLYFRVYWKFPCTYIIRMLAFICIVLFMGDSPKRPVFNVRKKKNESKKFIQKINKKFVSNIFYLRVYFIKKNCFKKKWGSQKNHSCMNFILYSILLYFLFCISIYCYKKPAIIKQNVNATVKIISHGYLWKQLSDGSLFT